MSNSVNATNMLTTSLEIVDSLALQIRPLVVKGAIELCNGNIRMMVNHLMAENRFDANLVSLDPKELMKRLTTHLVGTWPAAQGSFKLVQHEIPSLHQVWLILQSNIEAINEWVDVYDKPCVVQQLPRMPLVEFHRALLERIFEE